MLKKEKKRVFSTFAHPRVELNTGDCARTTTKSKTLLDRGRQSAAEKRPTSVLSTKPIITKYFRNTQIKAAASRRTPVQALPNNYSANKKPPRDIARAFDRGRGIQTNNERALKTRAFCNTQNLGEQFGEQTAIFEQVLTLFEKLDADRQAALLETLTARIKTAADTSR